MARASSKELSRTELIDELRRIAARLGRPLEASDVPRTMWWAVMRRFGSVAKAREEAGLPGPALNYRWSESLVLDEIRRLSRAGVVITHIELKRIEREDLAGAIVTYFHSIVRARRLAGAPEPPTRTWVKEQWDEERVVAEILERQRAGRPIASSKVEGRFLAAGIRYFGTWRAAIEAAGLEYDEVRLRRPAYTEDELLELLRDLARREPNMPRARLATLSYQPSLLAHFGSIEEALRRAGLAGWPALDRGRAYAYTSVIKRLRARRRAGKPIDAASVASDDHLLRYSAAVHFGDWNEALAAADIERDRPQRSWTRETILDELRDRVAHGKSIKTGDVLAEEPALYHAAKAHFGGYVAAATEVDGAPWATMRWTRELLIDELKRLAATGTPITARDVGSRVASACARYFGSVVEARRAAGLADPRDSAVSARSRRASR